MHWSKFTILIEEHHSVSPWIQGGENFFESFAEGGSTFFKRQEGNTAGGNPISDISLDHPGGECQLSPPKKFFEYL